MLPNRKRYILALQRDGKSHAVEFTNRRDRDREAQAHVAQTDVIFVEVYTSTRWEGGFDFQVLKGSRK